MLSHQLRCFLAAYEHGSFTAAAAALGYAQPSCRSRSSSSSERRGRLVPARRSRRRSHRRGRGLRTHAEAVLSNSTRPGVPSRPSRDRERHHQVRHFRHSRALLRASLVADVLARHPGVRVELIGQNSTMVHEELRRGRLEAAMIAIPVAYEGMTVRPVARDELVYISANPARTPRYAPSSPTPPWCCPRLAGVPRTRRGAQLRRPPNGPVGRSRRGSRSKTSRPPLSWWQGGWPIRSCP